MGLEDRIMKDEKVVMLNDIHVPFHDRETISAVHGALKQMKPNRVILGGDIIDFYSISRFDKDPLRRLHLDEEVVETEAYLESLRKAVPKSKIIYMPGNHEERLQKYINVHAPELAWVKELRLPSLLHLDRYGVEWHDKRWYEYRGILFSHLDRANKYGGYTAKNLGADFGKPVVHGHSHKVGNVQIGDTNFYDNGCLCNLDAEYVTGPSLWSQAFMVVDFIKDKPYFTQVPIQGSTFVYNGRLWTPKGSMAIPKRNIK